MARRLKLRRLVVYAFAACGLTACIHSGVRAMNETPSIQIECLDQTATLNILRDNGTVVGAVFRGPGGEPGFLVAQGGSAALLLLPPGLACVLPLDGLASLPAPIPVPGTPL